MIFQFTEHKVKTSSKHEPWRKTKKLGSLLGDREDIARRKQLATAALNDSNSLWIRNKRTRLKQRLRIYSATVPPILLYNSSTWGMSKNDEESLDAFHRQHLRRVMNVKWPHRISNKKLYKATNTKPISLKVVKARWRMFGHALRLHNQTPAAKAMRFFFKETGAKKFRGRPRTTIYTTLNKDIETLQATNDELLNKLNFPKNLNTIQELNILQSIAEDRKKWRNVCKILIRAAEANKSI